MSAWFSALSGRPCGLSGVFAHQQRLAITLDIHLVVIYIFLWWLNGELRNKIHSQPAQQKTKFLYFIILPIAG